MGKGITLLFAMIVMLSTFASAKLNFAYGEVNEGFINIPTTSASVNYTVVNTNSSLFWRNLGIPTDISGSQFWYNMTIPSQAYTDTKVLLFLNLSGTNANANLNISPFNLTASYFQSDNKIGIVKQDRILEDVNLVSLTKTYCNLTYAGGIVVNSTCGSSEVVDLTSPIFNSTYHNTSIQWNNNFSILYGSYNNVSYLSTANSTLDNLFNQNTTWWSLFIGSLNNDSYLSTANTTLNGLMSQNASMWGCYNNATYISTFNSTYDGFTTFNLTNFRNNLTDTDCVAGQLVIGIQANGTVLCAVDQQGSGGGLPYNQQLNITSNVTFNNLTITANSVFSQNITFANGGRLIGSLNSSTFPTTTCSGTDKVSAISTNGVLTCSTDSTGTGASIVTNFTRFDFTNTNATSRWNNTISLPVSANVNYTFNCLLISSASATTTGVQYNVTAPASPTTFNVFYQQATTTAVPLMTTCFGTANSCWLPALTSIIAGGGVVVNGRLENGANAGTISVQMRSELPSVLATMRRGSYCNLIGPN